MTFVLEVLMKNLTCVWRNVYDAISRNVYNTARATHSLYYKHFAKDACDFSLILLEPCNFLYKSKIHYKSLISAILTCC